MAQYTLGSVLLFKDSSTVYGSEATDWSGVDAVCIFSVAGAYFQLASPSSQIAMTSFVSYDQAATYSRGDLARHGGKYYVARRSTVGEVPTINSQAWMPTSRWSLTLNAPCPLDDQVALYAIHKDFTPNLSLPLVRPTDRNAIALLGRAMMQLDTYSGQGAPTEAIEQHNTATDAHADLRTLVGDRVPISTTRLGTVGSVPLTTTALTAADWAALPVGWSGIISADVAVASGLPAADVFHLHKVANRDVEGGYCVTAQGYLTPTLYIGAAATSDDLPTWLKAPLTAPSTTLSTVGEALLALATPASQKIPRINADGSVTLIDVPSGGGGSVPGPLEILGVRGDHLWADPAMLTGYTDGQAITDSINTNTLGPRTSVNLRIAGAPIYLSGVLNGHPVANFSGTAALTAISHAACSGQPFTAYFVLKFASLANAYTALLGPHPNEGFFVKSTGKSSWYSSRVNYDGSGAVTYSVGTWYILTVRVGFGGLVVRANGVTDYASASCDFAFGYEGQQVVVGNQLGQGGRGMYGQIAACILADAEHTDGEVSIVESALASRFAL